jgi:hypothetical protein
VLFRSFPLNGRTGEGVDALVDWLRAARLSAQS